MAVLAVALILGWWLLLTRVEKPRPARVGRDAVSDQFFPMGRERIFRRGRPTKRLLHCSVRIEEQFYLAFPLLIWLVKEARIGLLFGVPPLPAHCRSPVIFGSCTTTRPLRSIYPTRFWELLAGAVLAHAAMRLRSLFVQANAAEETVAAAAGLFVVLFGALTFEPAEGFSLQGLLVPVAGAALIIQARPAAWTNSKILSHASLQESARSVIPFTCGIGCCSASRG